MSANAAAWRTLTAVQQEGWTSLGLSMSRTDSLGQTYTLTGFQAFCSVNNNLDLIAEATVSAAPGLDTPETILTATITLTNAALSIAYTPTPMPADTHLLLFASPQRSAGRSFETDMRFIAKTAAAAASPFDAFTAYSAKFGTPVTGNKIFFSLVSSRGGFESGALLTSKVVA